MLRVISEIKSKWKKLFLLLDEERDYTFQNLSGFYAKPFVIKLYSSDTTECINIKCKHKRARNHGHNTPSLKRHDKQQCNGCVCFRQG